MFCVYTFFVYVFVFLFISHCLLFFDVTFFCCAEKLNSKRLVPFKDYDYDCLISTPLQYSMGTILLLDETKMFPGQLSEIALESVNGLKEIIQWQRLTYNFNFHMNEFPTDSPVISLSRCGWSILGKDLYSVPLRLPAASAGCSAGCSAPLLAPRVPAPLVPEKFLGAARAYVAMVRELDYGMEAPQREMIQEYFVSARKAPQSKVTQEDLHLWMTLARLVSLSYGETVLSEEAWKHVLDIEDRRKKSL